MPENLLDTLRQYAPACNAAILFAPQYVTDILSDSFNELLDYNYDEGGYEQVDEDKRVERLQRRLGELRRELLLAIRRDMKITPADNPNTFKYQLSSPLIDEVEVTKSEEKEEPTSEEN